MQQKCGKSSSYFSFLYFALSTTDLTEDDYCLTDQRDERNEMWMKEMTGRHDGTSPNATFEIKNEPHVEIMENNINIVNKKHNIL